jgi:hypothetical protein
MLRFVALLYLTLISTLDPRPSPALCPFEALARA